MAEIEYPPWLTPRIGNWLSPRTWWHARRKLRLDRSNEWRYGYDRDTAPAPGDRSEPVSRLISARETPTGRDGFRCLVLADTGEGDRSQYGLVPLLRALRPDFMIINGDLAYPAGREKDFADGFFRPYHGLDFPIWALPGNHEYYSPRCGAEFFELFCTEAKRDIWDDHGLPFVRQPGMYWELDGVDDGLPIVLLGLDTGQKGDLDGRGRHHDADDKQHLWLAERLKRAEQHNASAIVLFHIPALVKQRHDGRVHLRRLHRVLAGSRAVKAVLCGHEHNFQLYSPDTFADYLRQVHDVEQVACDAWFAIAGGGGAYLKGTEFADSPGPYPLAAVHPTPDQWRERVPEARKIVDRAGLSKALVGRMLARWNANHQLDEDAARLLSFLMIDVTPISVELRPILVDNAADLYVEPGQTGVVHLADPALEPRPEMLQALLERGPILSLHGEK